jgi:hypothetical protein
MANIFKPKRSGISSSIPTIGDLADGELAVNYYDKKIYIRNASSIIELSNNLSSTVAVTTTSYVVNGNDYYIGINTADAVSVTLPGISTGGTKFIVKDESGNAGEGENRYITISPTGGDLIDGQTQAILATNYGSLTFISNGTNWSII